MLNTISPIKVSKKSVVDYIILLGRVMIFARSLLTGSIHNPKLVDINYLEGIQSEIVFLNPARIRLGLKQMQTN
jgi:hypothetical protein